MCYYILKTKMAAKFSDSVTAELDALYKKGMVGIGAKYEGMMEMARLAKNGAYYFSNSSKL